MINIVFRDGSTKTYHDEEYDSYTYDRIVFVVIKGFKWIGFYNIAEVKSIEVV